ncbi:hypothetical protein BKA70DRAFT_733110 [Coprinopsis sp. MPI-PUGE-AT-0042]|nr:hypothetical protein BKA70DRAFT_733110 [Coprinopsis sp. MPI-PUGE-AT-0042]
MSYTAYERDGGTYSPRLQSNSMTEAGPPPNLPTIPPEIQYEILAHLEWNDILSLRQVSRSLYSASKARHIWLQLFKHYSETVISKPSPLPRPLQYCSTATLESLICGYLSSLQRPPQRSISEQRFTTPHLVHSFYLLPGGRWVLLINYDGSMSFVDFSVEHPMAASHTPPPWGEGVGQIPTADLCLVSCCQF